MFAGPVCRHSVAIKRIIDMVCPSPCYCALFDSNCPCQKHDNTLNLAADRVLSAHPTPGSAQMEDGREASKPMRPDQVRFLPAARNFRR
jgi:hypothetical protein